jgi:hypothetical protein
MSIHPGLGFLEPFVPSLSIRHSATSASFTLSAFPAFPAFPAFHAFTAFAAFPAFPALDACPAYFFVLPTSMNQSQQSIEFLVRELHPLDLGAPRPRHGSIQNPVVVGTGNAHRSVRIRVQCMYLYVHELKHVTFSRLFLSDYVMAARRRLAPAGEALS